MTPCIDILNSMGVSHEIHRYAHDPSSELSYGLEASEKLGVEPSRIFKTLIVDLGSSKYGVAMIPVSSQLNLKQMGCAVSAAKKPSMVNIDLVKKITGYYPGAVSPIGQKKQLVQVIDSSAELFSTIFVSAGKRGLEIELSASDLIKITGSKVFIIGSK